MREKREGKKKLCQSSTVHGETAHTSLPLKGRQDTSNTALKCSVPPTKGVAYTNNFLSFNLICENIKVFITPHNINKKYIIKDQKNPSILDIDYLM
jgi:hypothetical protein